MEQMQIPEDMKVDVDYDTVDLPDSAKILEPVVFKEGDSYCCLLGPDPQTGIFGCGDTAELAVEDWNKNLQDAMVHITEGDPEVLKYVNEKLSASPVNNNTH
jgi:hypothetical protein